MKRFIFSLLLLTVAFSARAQSLSPKYLEINEQLRNWGASIETVQKIETPWKYRQKWDAGSGAYEVPDTVIEIMIYGLNTKKKDILNFMKEKLKEDFKNKHFQFKHTASFYLQRSAKKRTLSKMITLLGGGLGGALVAIGAKERSTPLLISGSAVAGSSALTSLVLEFSSDADLRKAASALEAQETKP